jgi:hypothetical protein
MGYAISWLAVRGKTADEVRRLLRLHTTGEREEVPESPITGVDLPGGWYLVFADDFSYAQGCDLARLSSDAEVVTFAAEEHVMYFAASGWTAGRQIWSVIHDAQQGLYHLEASGDLPEFFEDIRARHLSRQRAAGQCADVDHVSDIPVELAANLTGFRYDQDLPVEAGAAPYEVLE